MLLLMRCCHTFLIICILGKLYGKPYKDNKKHSGRKKDKINTKIHNHLKSNLKNHGVLSTRTRISGGEDIDQTAFDNFERNPILWTEYSQKKAKNSKPLLDKCKKGDACSRTTSSDGFDDLPSTVEPNPNIFGGFPENDNWGNFELPSPEILAKLKLNLKDSPSQTVFETGEMPDPIKQMYDYENHALPEYDVVDTPSLQQLWAQHIKQHNGPCKDSESGCPQVSTGTCAHFNALCDINAKHPKQGETEYEGPCASKILEMFGCKEKVTAKQPIALPQIGKTHEKAANFLKQKKKKLAPVILPDEMSKNIVDTIKNTQQEINKVIKSMNLVKAEPLNFIQNKYKNAFSEDGTKRLIKEEESLFLLRALGNDLQQNFAKLHLSKNEDSGESAGNYHGGNRKNNKTLTTYTKQINRTSSKLKQNTSDISQPKKKKLTTVFKEVTVDDNGGMLTEGKEIPMTDHYQLRKFYEKDLEKLKNYKNHINFHETREIVEENDYEVRPY